EFARVVSVDRPQDYKLCVAIAEKLMGGTLHDVEFPDVAEMYGAGKSFAGLLYPSLAMRCNADNLCLLPTAVDFGLTCEVAWLDRVDEVLSDGKYKVTHIDYADNVAATGEIVWL